MHPTLITALASAVERDRRSERDMVRARSLAARQRRHGYRAPGASAGIAARLRVSLSPRARLS
jgi:hypothetical protein